MAFSDPVINPSLYSLDYIPLPKPLKVKAFKKYTAESCRKQSSRRNWKIKEREGQVVMRLGTIICKCWTCSQIYKAFLWTCVWMSASSMGKLSKATTISLPPFFLLFAFWSLCTQGLSQHCATDTARTCHLNYNHGIAHIFKSLNYQSRRASHSSVQLWCTYPSVQESGTDLN